MRIVHRSSVTAPIVLAALAAFAALAGGCKKGGAKDKPPVEPAAPVVKLAPEDVVTVTRGMLQTGPRISGTLDAGQVASVRAEAGGTVVAIGRELGDPVKKGDLLAKIEAKALGDVSSSARAGLSSAQAQRDLAKREVERTAALVKGGAVAQRELDRAQSQLAAAEAAVTQARAQVSSSSSQLGDATARSPINGVVARRTVNKGDVVMMGTELYQIIDPSTMRLDASVASDDLGALTAGKNVNFEVRGYPGQKFEDHISRIAPAADPVTRQIQVLVEIPNPGNKLIAGLYAEGRISVEEREALVVPMTAIDSSGDQPTVLRAKDGVLERSVVALGLRDERAETVEVTSGLAAGDVIVLGRATRNVAAGTKVSLPGTAPVAPVPAPAGSGSGSAPGSGAKAQTPAPPAPPPSAAAAEKH